MIDEGDEIFGRQNQLRFSSPRRCKSRHQTGTTSSTNTKRLMFTYPCVAEIIPQTLITQEASDATIRKWDLLNTYSSRYESIVHTRVGSMVRVRVRVRVRVGILSGEYVFDVILTRVCTILSYLLE